ncbi:tetratricopeptide repeat protein [Flavobacterium sp. 3HN19-14]|uniref:tetratricopeptide repeat protein n=1 Tax=Flavobacterium sp. 3HN19-14 TaxID=3448133 RepID=UPI003EE08263
MFIRNLLLFSITAMLALNVNAQRQDGYWDKDRATTKQIIVGAGKRTLIRTEDLPVGTTEVVYRITLLDDNQQMANSLVSVLKAIPDPSGISQGSAGAVFLLSKISGDDKCKYAIFSTAEQTKNYLEDGKSDKACFAENTPLNKDAKRLTMDKLCFKDNSGALWFGFESDNWIMKQKIVLEVVPWVDIKLSKGWNNDNRKVIIKLAKSSDLVKKMTNSDDFCLCILEKMMSKYKFNEYENAMAIEKSKAFRDFGNQCLTEKPANVTILNNIRQDAAQYFKKKKYAEAIDLMETAIMDNGTAKVLDFNALGQYYLYSKQYEKAIQMLKAGEKIDNSELRIKLNLAHAYLLDGDYKSAKELHKKYMSQNITAKQSWKAQTKADFEDFKNAGIESKDFERILNLFE